MTEGRTTVSVRSDCSAGDTLVSDSVRLAKWTLKGLVWRSDASAGSGAMTRSG